MSIEEMPAGPGGGYITRGRALELERQMAALDARLTQRMDQLETAIGRARAANIDALRAQMGALLEVYRGELAGEAPAEAHPLRRTGGT